MRKQELLQRFREELQRMLADAERSRDEAQAESNRHIGKMESRYDTFKEESQTLADNFEHTARGIRASLRQLDALGAETESPEAIGVGSVFSVVHEGVEKRFLMFSSGGGIRLGTHVVITPESPLGALLAGKRVSDTVVISINGKQQAYEIRAIE